MHDPPHPRKRTGLRFRGCSHQSLVET